MSEDLSTMIRLGVMLLLAASSVSTLLTLLILANGIFADFNSLITDAFSNLPVSTVRSSLNELNSVSGAEVWRVMQEFYYTVDEVHVYDLSGELSQDTITDDNFIYFLGHADDEYQVRFSTYKQGFDFISVLTVKEVE